MHTSIKWIIALVCVCASQFTFAQGSKRLESHLNNAMQSFINNDEHSFRALYPTFHQYIDMMEDMGLGTMYQEDIYSQPAIRVAYQNERMKELNRDVNNSFKQIRRSLSNKSWYSLEFIDYMIDYKNIQSIENGIKVLNGMILAYDYYEQDYVLFRFTNVVFHENRFLGIEMRKLEPQFTVYKRDFKAIAKDYFSGKLAL